MGIEIGKTVVVVAAHSYWYDRKGIVDGYNDKFRMWNVVMDNGEQTMFGEAEIQVTEDPIENKKHNKHYEDMGIQPFDVVETWELPQRIGAYRAFAVKYLMRLDVKEDRLVQAEKALECTKRLINTIKRG